MLFRVYALQMHLSFGRNNFLLQPYKSFSKSQSASYNLILLNYTRRSQMDIYSLLLRKYASDLNTYQLTGFIPGWTPFPEKWRGKWDRVEGNDREYILTNQSLSYPENVILIMSFLTSLSFFFLPVLHKTEKLSLLQWFYYQIKSSTPPTDTFGKQVW